MRAPLTPTPRALLAARDQREHQRPDPLLPPKGTGLELPKGTGLELPKGTDLYFPKGTGLSAWSQDHLGAIADKIGARPRKTLGYHTPAKALNDLRAATAA